MTTAAAATGAALAAAPADAAIWTVSLSASTTAAASNQSVTLTAYASGDVGPTPYYISIFENDTGTQVAQCGFGSTCSGTVSQVVGAHGYTAYIGAWSSTAPPPDLQAQSNTVVVTWGAPTVASPCATGSFGLYACLTPGSLITRVTAYWPGVAPLTTAHVAGYVDLYSFTVSSITTTLPCVVLGTATNACSAAGGTFVRRLVTLVDDDVVVPGPVLYPLARIGVCNATLTLTVDDIGINSAPAVTVC